MRKIVSFLISLWLVGSSISAAEPVVEIKKTLRHLLDSDGRHTKSPSLLDRDAYQAHLKENPAEVNGLRFDLQIRYASRTPAPVTIRVEIRHGKGTDILNATFETPFEPKKRRRSQWGKLLIEKKDFRDLGEIIAWRVSLMDGDETLATDESFLW